LHAADSIQLASALLWCNEKSKGKPFITFDARLADAAAKAGFAVHTTK
jgi:predicted nucleic acid-binding protein